VFLFFVYPILEIPLVIRATPEEKDTSILAVTIDFLLAGGNVAMVFVFIVLSLVFSEA
jgi:hypothetical protein